jgi:crotonobetainyl-CoA:carnitine CoA-transferase CaiB-like acyl-CoA transferase
MEQALSDVTVLDLGQVIAMPFCTMLLADLGARVIKVESRERGRERISLGIKRVRDGVEERVPAAQYRDRNKLSVTLELKTPQGVALFKELVRHADVVTENFSVGTMDRLGLGWDDLKTINPGLVFASVTAFGQHGPYADQRGYDILAQAISGYAATAARKKLNMAAVGSSDAMRGRVRATAAPDSRPVQNDMFSGVWASRTPSASVASGHVRSSSGQTDQGPPLRAPVLTVPESAPTLARP